MNRRTFDIDFLTLLLVLALAVMGWLTIYAVSSANVETSAFDLRFSHGKQFMWIGISMLAATVIISLDNRFLEATSYIVYGLSIFLLILTLVIGREVNGATSWLMLGGFQFQPSEIAKVGTAMALGRYMSQLNFSLKNRQQAFIAFGILLLPAIIVIAQNDTGSALVFGSLLIVLFREGLNPAIPIFLIAIGVVAILTLWTGSFLIVMGVIIGLAILSFWLLFDRRRIFSLLFLHAIAVLFFAAFSFSTGLIVKKLPDHQQNRIMVLFDPGIDPQGVGYNVRQSKIAIGSGGLWGKGFLQGNYTKYDFVPKQDTDFIFCTIGEEQGWVGTTFVIGFFFLLLLRLRYLAENSKTRYARIYGYSVLSIIFFHVFINIGMTIGLVPVIGIPLPFFSYGGSSLLAFTILVSILVNHYSYRSTILGAKY